jgi:hypothetical protein
LREIGVNHCGAAIWSLTAASRTLRGHRKSVAPEPTRHPSFWIFAVQIKRRTHFAGGKSLL